MAKFGAALASAGEALGDLVSKELRLQAVLSFVGAAGLLIASVWAAVTYIPPLIPAGGEGAAGLALSILRFVLGAGFVLVGLFLLPPVTMLIGGMLFDRARRQIEEKRLGIAARAGGGPLAGLGSGLGAGVRVSVPSFIANLAFLPAWLAPIVSILGFVLLNAFVSGRAYFDLAAGAQSGVLKRAHGGTIFLAGLPIAILMLIPAVQFLAPVFGAAIMTRLFHKLNANPAS